MSNNTQQSRSTSSNSKYVNRDAYYKQRQLLYEQKHKQLQRRNNFLLCSHVLRLFLPFLGIILFFRFMYQGEGANISFSNIWNSLSQFDLGSEMLMRSMDRISHLDLELTTLPRVTGFATLFLWLYDVGSLFKDIGIGLFGIVSLPVALIISAFDIILFAMSVLFGA